MVSVAKEKMVYDFNPSQSEVNKIYRSFIDFHERNSEKTAVEYASRIEEFFESILGRELKFVTIEDIQGIMHNDVKTFVKTLSEKGNTDKTIAAKLYSVASFYNELQKNNIAVNPAVLKVSLKIKKNHHESLSFEELEELYQFVLAEKEKPLMKYLYLKTLFTTGNRKTATLNMKWSNFSRKTDMETGRRVWVVTVTDKGGKEIEKPISDEFYEELQQLNDGQEKVFQISDKTIERSLKRFSEQVGRNITIHSMKATGVTLGYQLTKNINLCKQYASHEDISTTAIYLRDEKSYVNQLSYNMSRELEESRLLEMSREELIEFLMDHKNRDIKNSILLRLQ